MAGTVLFILFVPINPDLVALYKGEDKDPDAAKLYRPICILRNLEKTLKSSVCDRLKPHRLTMELLRPDRSGFMSGLPTEDALNRLVRKVESAGAKHVVVIFVDIAGAFDNLWYTSLFKEPRDIPYRTTLTTTSDRRCP